MQSMKTKDIFMYVLGALIVLGTFVLIAMLLIYRTEMTDVINITIGSLLAAFGLVVGYFYGSSKGSADKTDMMKKP
jgi:uncharacterized membrane protein